jgi:hypothetical protein
MRRRPTSRSSRSPAASPRRTSLSGHSTPRQTNAAAAAAGMTAAATTALSSTNTGTARSSSGSTSNLRGTVADWKSQAGSDAVADSAMMKPITYYTEDPIENLRIRYVALMMMCVV